MVIVYSFNFLDGKKLSRNFESYLMIGNLTKILVAHEGDWTTEEGMSCHFPYKRYEDVQKDLGKGLIFKRKGFSKVSRRSLFLFEIDKTCNEHILAVPATGEEIYFEIYGIDKSGDLVLLVEREL